MNRFGNLDCSFKRLSPIYDFHSQELVSIEKAFEPIESQIKDLSRYMGRNNSLSCFKSSIKIRKSISFKNLVSLFDTALDLLPTVKESVWRGVQIS